MTCSNPHFLANDANSSDANCDPLSVSGTLYLANIENLSFCICTMPYLLLCGGVNSLPFLLSSHAYAYHTCSQTGPIYIPNTLFNTHAVMHMHMHMLMLSFKRNLNH